MLRPLPRPYRWASIHLARTRSSARLQVRCLTSLTEQDINHFSKILPPASIISTFPPSNAAEDELTTFNTDWMVKYKGKSRAVLKPKTTQEVSEILKWCWEHRIGVVPQGGNTGLVGGGVPLNDEIILNLGNMNKIRSFDPVSGSYSSTPCFQGARSINNFCFIIRSGVLVADAGCILESLSEHIMGHNHIMPLDLGAKGRYGN